jgi:DNA-damage-inducible protein D
METDKLAVFHGSKIRRLIHKNEWWFSILDVIKVLSETEHAKTYWAKMKERDKELFQPFPIWEQLKLTSSDGKKYETDCANTEGIFRIVQSIPSPKAEPFKRWLAKVGYERVQEIEDPELAAKEFAILTAEISQATFGMTPSKYKKFKNLKRENLRDHMDDLELIFSMLGEASTTKIARSKNALGFTENKVAAHKGGKVAGNARKELEKESGEKVSTKNNYLDEPQSQKRLGK